MPKKPYGAKRKLGLTVTVDLDMIGDLKRTCKTEGVPLSLAINRALKEYVARLRAGETIL